MKRCIFSRQPNHCGKHRCGCSLTWLACLSDALRNISAFLLGRRRRVKHACTGAGTVFSVLQSCAKNIDYHTNAQPPLRALRMLPATQCSPGSVPCGLQHPGVQPQPSTPQRVHRHHPRQKAAAPRWCFTSIQRDHDHSHLHDSNRHLHDCTRSSEVNVNKFSTTTSASIALGSSAGHTHSCRLHLQGV